ncbi:MAG: MBL fold metallo-hydrolase [Planctomycetales bacterium]|nr:MBL fold metallo-hydrolase [Planctomycetales bacterium]
MIFLGTGTSVGVPVVGCGCATCTSDNPRNHRTRCGVVLGLPGGNLLIDTPIELRLRLTQERIGIIHATLFTHSHADHIFGLDDLRLFPLYTGQPMPLYCEANVEQQIRQSFDYAFHAEPVNTHRGARPQLEFHRITTEPFDLLGTRVTPLRLRHGAGDVLGFRFGNVAYCTDTNEIPDESMALLQGLDVLILDALRPNPHPTHFSLDEAIEVARRLQPRRTLFTHISCKLEHQATNARLPVGMELAYDGLQVPLS